MKLKTGQVTDAHFAISEVLKKELPSLLAYRLTVIKNQMKDIVVSFEQEKAKLFKTLGKDNGDGTMQITPENIDEYKKQIEPILSEECELKVKQLKIDDFKDITVPSYFFDHISWLIKE